MAEPLQGFLADCSLCTLSLTTVTGVAAQELKLGEEKLSDLSKSRKCSFRTGDHLCGEARCTSPSTRGVCVSFVLQASHSRTVVTSRALE